MIPVRMLDALHLASIEFLRARGQTRPSNWRASTNGRLLRRVPFTFRCLSYDAHTGWRSKQRLAPLQTARG